MRVPSLWLVAQREAAHFHCRPSQAIVGGVANLFFGVDWTFHCA